MSYKLNLKNDGHRSAVMEYRRKRQRGLVSQARHDRSMGDAVRKLRSIRGVGSSKRGTWREQERQGKLHMIGLALAKGFAFLSK
jgi:hypothetical protein